MLLILFRFLLLECCVFDVVLLPLLFLVCFVRCCVICSLRFVVVDVRFFCCDVIFCFCFGIVRSALCMVLLLLFNFVCLCVVLLFVFCVLFACPVCFVLCFFLQ